MTKGRRTDAAKDMIEKMTSENEPIRPISPSLSDESRRAAGSVYLGRVSLIGAHSSLLGQTENMFLQPNSHYRRET